MGRRTEQVEQWTLWNNRSLLNIVQIGNHLGEWRATNLLCPEDGHDYTDEAGMTANNIELCILTRDKNWAMNDVCKFCQWRSLIDQVRLYLFSLPDKSDDWFTKIFSEEDNVLVLRQDTAQNVGDKISLVCWCQWFFHSSVADTRWCRERDSSKRRRSDSLLLCSNSELLSINVSMSSCELLSALIVTRARAKRSWAVSCGHCSSCMIQRTAVLSVADLAAEARGGAHPSPISPSIHYPLSSLRASFPPVLSPPFPHFPRPLLFPSLTHP